MEVSYCVQALGLLPCNGLLHARLFFHVRTNNRAISLTVLPAPMHSVIADACIDKSTDLVTASYESDAMRQLDER